MDQVSENKRAYILGYPVDLIDMDNSIDFAKNCIEASNGGHVVTLNPEMIMQADHNAELSGILKGAELVVPDGIGIIIALKKLGITNIKQLPGIEFSQALIKKCAENNYSIGLIGASKDTLDCAVNEIKAKYPDLNIVFAHDGYFNESNENEIIEELKTKNPQVLFVALGVPKQELWIKKHRKDLNSVLMVGVGGSFDVWAKKIKRAPVIFRKFGLEWLYRLITQPSRFSRMFPTLPLFFIKVALDFKNTRKN